MLEENFAVKHHEFQKQIKNIERPENINGICNIINKNFKDNFLKHTIKTADKLMKIRTSNVPITADIAAQT
jgi:hypothetical protein